MRNMQSITKRALAYFLSLAMCVSLLSTAVYAAEADGADGTGGFPALSDTITNDETSQGAGTEGGDMSNEGNNDTVAGGAALDGETTPGGSTPEGSTPEGGAASAKRNTPTTKAAMSCVRCMN